LQAESQGEVEVNAKLYSQSLDLGNILDLFGRHLDISIAVDRANVAVCTGLAVAISAVQNKCIKLRVTKANFKRQRHDLVWKAGIEIALILANCG